MTRRIVCWLTDDPASLVAARLVIRENAQQARPLPLVVIAPRTDIDADYLRDAIEWLGVPVALIDEPASTFREPLAGGAQAARYRLPDDAHVLGIPVDEQARYDAFVHDREGVLVYAALADRALTRADCMTLVQRAQIRVRASATEGAKQIACAA